MSKQDRIFIIQIILFSFIIFLEISKVLNFQNFVKEKINEEKNIYYYSQDDDEIKNPELLDFFVTNCKAKLDNVLKIEIIGDYEEEVMYGIEYINDKFTVYMLINDCLIATKQYNYLNEISYNGYNYYFLSEQDEFYQEKIEAYFNGEAFELFEIGRIKIN